jgi:hypothetical protein
MPGNSCRGAKLRHHEPALLGIPGGSCRHRSTWASRWARIARASRALPRRGAECKPDTSLESRRIGAELPAGIYKTIVAAYAWMLLVTWLDFSGIVEASWLAAVAILIGIVFFGIPFLLRCSNRDSAGAPQPGLETFLHSDLETATGRLPGRDSYLQIITIPICLALAATALGTIWVWEG